MGGMRNERTIYLAGDVFALHRAFCFYDKPILITASGME